MSFRVRPVRRLLLVYPPERALKGFFRANVPPLGTAYLAAYVREEVEVEILDAKCEGYGKVRDEGAFEVYGLSPEEIEDRIREFEPDAVGITCLASFNWPEVRKVAGRARAVDPEILTLTGGTHPSFLSRACLEQAPEIDIIVRGEGEATLLGLIRASQDSGDISALAGVAYRENGEAVVRDFPAPIEVDSLPMPARDLLAMERYFQTRAPFSRIFRHQRNTSIQTSRGCPAHCTFCSSARFWGHGYRGQSPPRVLSEMEHLKDRYGVRELQFVDDNLIFDRDRAKALFEGMIERDLKLDWCMPNGVALWRLDKELLRLMKRAGCYSLTLAFESGNQRVLSTLVKKPLKLEKVPPLIEEIKRLGIQMHAFFISGFPGETKDEMKETYRLARSLDLDGAYFFIATPLPGTELCEKGMELGHLPKDLEFTSIEFNKGHFNTQEWSAKEVERLTGTFYLRFMLSVLFRHPARFTRNYGRVIVQRPRYALKHFFAYLKRLARELMEGEGYAAD